MFRTGAFRCGPSRAPGLSISRSAALTLGCAAGSSAALGLCVGQLASASSAHPPEVSGMGAQPVFQVCTPTQALCVCAPRQPGHLSGRAPTGGFRCEPQATDWGTHPLGHFGSGAQAAGRLIRVHTHPEFQLWAPSPLIWLCATGLQLRLLIPHSQSRDLGGRGVRGRSCCRESSK